jgi:hypothetical protein
VSGTEQTACIRPATLDTFQGFGLPIWTVPIPRQPRADDIGQP